jgi:hypothetical protein
VESSEVALAILFAGIGVASRDMGRKADRARTIAADAKTMMRRFSGETAFRDREPSRTASSRPSS